MAATIILKHGTTAGYAAAEANGRIYDDGELLVEIMENGNIRWKQGDGINPYSKGILAAESADKAAVSLQNAQAVETAVKNDLQSVTEVKVEVAALKSAADETLEQCKGYAGAASFAFGPDSDGNFSFFINEDDPE